MVKLFLGNILFVVALMCVAISLPEKSVARNLYGYEIPDSLISSLAQQQIADKKNNTVFSTVAKVTPRQAMDAKPHVYRNRVFDFYSVLFLVTILAILKAFHPQYFKSLWKAFTNSTLSTRQLKDQLQNNAGANLGMNIFFCLSLAMYAFYTIRYLNKGSFGSTYSPIIILIAAILVLVCTYTLRYASLKFAGWVFNIDTATDSYTFNIFLINKILSVVLLPFTVIVALGNGQWVQVALFLSFIIIILLTLNRFARSGASMRSFLRYSRFHFFLYLCASEILPIAILWKVMYMWMLR